MSGTQAIGHYFEWLALSTKRSTSTPGREPRLPRVYKFIKGTHYHRITTGIFHRGIVKLKVYECDCSTGKLEKI